MRGDAERCDPAQRTVGRSADDRPTSVLEHELPHGIRGVEDDLELGAQDVAEEIDRHLCERGEAKAGGVVVEDIDSAQRLGSAIHPLPRRVGVGEVHGVALHVIPLLPKRGRGLLGGTVGGGAADHARAFLGEDALRGLPLPSRGTSDQDALPVESAHVFHLMSSLLGFSK